MYIIGICDDCSNDIEKLKAYIKSAINYTNNINIYEYENGERLLQDIDRYHHLIFLDILMPGANGNAIAKEIRKKNSDAVLVFCSGIVQPTPDIFRVQPFRYLVKQDDKRVLQKEIIDILDEMIHKIKISYLTVRYDGKIIRIRTDGIIYVSIYHKQCKIYITRKEKERIGFKGETDRGKDGIVCMKKLDEIRNELEKYGFACAHKSYLVNLACIIQKDKEKLKLVENILLNCSRSKEKEFKQRFLEYLSHRLN